MGWETYTTSDVMTTLSSSEVGCAVRDWVNWILAGLGYAEDGKDPVRLSGCVARCCTALKYPCCFTHLRRPITFGRHAPPRGCGLRFGCTSCMQGNGLDVPLRCPDDVPQDIHVDQLALTYALL